MIILLHAQSFGFELQDFSIFSVSNIITDFILNLILKNEQ